MRDGSYVPSLLDLRRGAGERRVLGLDLAAGNDEGSAWPRFERSLVERGLAGVRLLISYGHASAGQGHWRAAAGRPRLGT